MNEVIKTYNNILSLNIDPIEKILLLSASMVESEINSIDSINRTYLIEICKNVLCSLNEHLIDNQILYTMLTQNKKDSNTNDILVNFIKNREKLMEELNKSKDLFEDIYKAKFMVELKPEIDKRRSCCQNNF